MNSFLIKLAIICRRIRMMMQLGRDGEFYVLPDAIFLFARLEDGL